MNLDNLFLDYCGTQKFDVNSNQIETIKKLQNFINKNQFSILDIFQKKIKNMVSTLWNVGVGKIMLLNFFMKILNIKN